MPYKDKEKRRAYEQEYRANNKVKIKAYRDSHKKEKQLSDKLRRKNNKEKIKAYDKARYEANKENANACCKHYRETHKKEIKLRMKTWIKANPDKPREQGRKYRARKYQTQVESINEKEVFVRDGWICQICHKKVDKRFKYPNPMSASLDHIVPLSKGGTHTYNNVQLTHWICNVNKYNNVLPQGEQRRLF